MDSGLVLVFNIPALMGTIFVFLCFWFYFNYFSLRVETLLTRNFGDNLRKLYWLRKGKRFFWKLIYVTIAALIFNVVLYSLFFNATFNKVRPNNLLLFKEMIIATICFIIAIVWVFLINWISYTIIFIYKKNKHAKVEINPDKILLYEIITDLRIVNVGNKKNYNNKIAKKAENYIETIKSNNYNKLIKSSIVMIEFYCLTINNEYLNSINDTNSYVKNITNNAILSKKEFIIAINSFFNDAIQIN